MDRLRARNNELLAAEEECELVELQNDELKVGGCSVAAVCLSLLWR